jgi:hypothetical protein
MKIDFNGLKSTCGLGVFLGASALTVAMCSAAAGSPPSVSIAVATPTAVVHSVRHQTRTAKFGSATPTESVRWLANWVADTHDNGNAAFVLVDKRAAQVHVFDAQAHWVASSAVLLGAALGDDSVPEIGVRPMALIKPYERTTPAGRFVGERGRNAGGDDIVWVDYDAAVSMHRVRLTNPSERRAERLASLTSDDNRISYGCINVPVAFFDAHIQPIFSGQNAIVYVLPDVKAVQEVFGPDVAASPTANGSHSTAVGIATNSHTSSPRHGAQ